MSMFKQKLLFVLIFLAIMAIGAIAFFVYRFNQPVGSEGKAEITINPGESTRQIGKKLEEAKLIDSASFVLYVRFKNLTTKIQAGRYEIPLTLSPVQIIELLQHGTFDIRLTFLEGWRREEYLEYGLSKLAVDDDAFSAEFLKETKDLEGYLFPDTYLISIDATAKDLVAELRANFDKRYNDNVLAQEKKSGLSKSQIVIIASMLERETSSKSGEDEMRTIAGILIKRLKSDWRLDVDATVQYVLGRQWNSKKERWEWWKDVLTSQDLKIDSIYNTYKFRGLPPGPIANPGLAALSAVANSKSSNYWFYLHCSGGQVRYARTLAEQVSNRSCIKSTP